jgi:hypothetical protein
MRPDSEVEGRLPLRELPPPPGLSDEFPAGVPATRYQLGECSVLVTREFGDWHLSIAHPSRDPTWGEISQARYRIIPDDIWMAMYLPPREEYVNLHRFCFQMTSCKRPPERGPAT